MLAMGWVKVVFDAVVGPAWQLFRDVRPLITESFVQFEDLLLFFSANRIFLDVRVQVVVPSSHDVLCFKLLTFRGIICLFGHWS